MGRPAKHLYGLNRVSRSLVPKTEPQRTFQGRDQTPDPGPETLCSSPIRYLLAPFVLSKDAKLVKIPLVEY